MITKQQLIAAKNLAHYHHTAIDQRRKYTFEPYIVHPAAVAKILSSVTSDLDIIAAGWLHDTLEDTDCTELEIVTATSKHVLDMVKELTDPVQEGNRKERHLKNCIRLGSASADVKTVKLADSFHNVKDIMKNDPKFGVVYVEEKKLLLPYLEGGNRILFSELKNILYP